MFTQVELQAAGSEDRRVFWLNHDPVEHHPIKVGQGVRLVESPLYWVICGIFTNLKNLTDLPVKATVGTVLELN